MATHSDLLRIPTRAHVQCARGTDRVSAPRGVLLSVDEQSYHVRDLCDSGLSVHTSDHRFARGAQMEVWLEWQEQPRWKGVFTVRHSPVDRDQPIAGGSIVFATNEDRRRWLDELDALRYPYTRVGGDRGAELWDLFEASGYFRLSQKQIADFAHCRESFSAMSRTLALNPHLGIQVVWPSSRGLEVTTTAMAEYPKTAMLFHMAKRPGTDPRGMPAKRLLRETYLRAVQWVRRRHVDWISIWIQDAARFSRGLHLDFVRHRVDNVLAAIHTFHALEVPVDLPSAVRGWKVRLATDSESLAIMARAREQFPSPLVSARSWDMSKVEIAAEWEAAGLMRDRTILVAMRHGELRAAAICDVAQDGAHVFGLLDVAHTVSFTDDPEPLQAVLHGAALWYRAHGKRHFIYAAREGEAVQGARDLGRTHATVTNTALLGELTVHVYRFTSSESS